MSLDGIKKLGLIAGLLCLSYSAQAQIVTQGRIVYERKTNLKKLFKGNKRVEMFLDKDVTWRIEEFEMFFNDSLSAFTPIESDEPEQGFMKYLTSHNQIYKNLNSNERLAVMDMWGTETYMLDQMEKKTWKITNRTRKLAGYECTRAIWEQDDTTRIYAWFAPELVPTTGPEGFGGLPGTILGLATENGAIIYFAKEVEIIQPTQEQLTRSTKGKDVYTQQELKDLLMEKMGKWVKPEDLEGMFAWL